jgi:hypothetical protein
MDESFGDMLFPLDPDEDGMPEVRRDWTGRGEVGLRHVTIGGCKYVNMNGLILLITAILVSSTWDES